MIFEIKYKHLWSTRWNRTFVAASNLEEAKIKAKQMVQLYWDVAEYIQFEYYIQRFEFDLSYVLKSLKENIPENKLNEYFVKDVIE